MRIRRPIAPASRRGGHASLEIIHCILSIRIKRLKVLLMVVVVVVLLLLNKKRPRDIVVGLLLIQIGQRAFERAINRVGSEMSRMMALEVSSAIATAASVLQRVGFMAGVYA